MVHRHRRGRRDAVLRASFPRAHHGLERAQALSVLLDSACQGPAGGAEEDHQEEGHQDPAARALRSSEQAGDASVAVASVIGAAVTKTQGLRSDPRGSRVSEENEDTKSEESTEY
jgi:hypothetical protein